MEIMHREYVLDFLTENVINFYNLSAFCSQSWTALVGLGLLTVAISSSYSVIHTTLRSTPLEISARRRDLYLTTLTTDRHP